MITNLRYYMDKIEGTFDKYIVVYKNKQTQEIKEATTSAIHMLLVQLQREYVTYQIISINKI